MCCFQPKSDVSSHALLANIPLAVLDAAICWWISFDTSQHLLNMRVEKPKDSHRLSTAGMSVFRLSLISDFFRIKDTGIKLIKYGQNMDKISIIFKYRLDRDKRLDIPSLNSVSKH